MSKRDLGEKYGSSKNSTQLVNAAIRAEIPGGSEALDALDKLRPAGGQALEAIRSIVDAMGDEIRRRYQMPPRED
jgi:hypothetical protein